MLGGSGMMVERIEGCGRRLPWSVVRWREDTGVRVWEPRVGWKLVVAWLLMKREIGLE